MKIRLLLIALALAGSVAFATGCNEDGSLSLEEYFERVEELSQEEDERSAEIEQELDDLGQDLTPEDVADSFEEQLNNFEELVDGLRDIDPPSEVEDVHDEAVEALGAAREDFEGVIDELRDAESIEDVSAVFEGIDEANFDRATQACRDLQQSAEDNNVEVDLRCNDE